MQNVGPTASNVLRLASAMGQTSSVSSSTRVLELAGLHRLHDCDVSGNSVGIVTNDLYVAQVDLTPLGINLKDGAVHQSPDHFRWCKA